jgi:hypothetical protein
MKGQRAELFHEREANYPVTVTFGPDVCDIDIKRRILQRRPKPQFTVRYLESGVLVQYRPVPYSQRQDIDTQCSMTSLILFSHQRTS